MAKNFSKAASPSRIRFVMVEAELGDGDVGQITQAIQNALRSPATSSIKRIAPTTGPNGATSQPEHEPEVEDFEQDEIIDASPAPLKARASRKPPSTPNIVEIDMNADVSLSSFVQGKDAKSQNKKYMIAAAWLKEHRRIDAVTADHIYTCFRSIGWSVGIPDFWQPLRNLKAKKYFTQNENGEYAINHLGLDFVRRLGGSNGAG
jgi:hypothetical protein